jgi:DNA polymerase III delta subunit
MATFMQWSARKNLKRIAWVCGPEQVLQREVVEAYREAVPAGGRMSLYAGRQDETELWDQVLTEPGHAARLVVVHDADKLKFTGNFEVLAYGEAPATAFTVFISSAPDFPRLDGQKKRQLAPHVAAIQASKDGQLVRCTVPSKEEDLVQLVASWWPGAGGNLAHGLLKRVGGDLDEAHDACWKARLAALEPDISSVDLVAEMQPAAGFADLLLAGEQRDAMSLAGTLTRGEVGVALATLITKLEKIDLIRAARSEGMERAEMAVRLRLDRYTLHQLFPLVPQYSDSRVRAARELLALAESHYRSGAFEGVPEAVVALW